ncbi:MAG: hypothetical protein ABJE05_00015, partial [Nitratireductor sp.]
AAAAFAIAVSAIAPAAIAAATTTVASAITVAAITAVPAAAIAAVATAVEAAPKITAAEIAAEVLRTAELALAAATSTLVPVRIAIVHYLITLIVCRPQAAHNPLNSLAKISRDAPVRRKELRPSTLSGLG